jgi:mRNA-degrading endonuclease RelE of RelBE toxin-antitoxin system
MREISYHRNAVRYLKRMPIDRKEQVKAAIAELARLPDVSLHPNVKVMQAEWAGCYRLRIGSYRAIFQITRVGPAEVVEVLLVGPRGDIY